MRDPETISLALTAAETGHLVLSTLHTNSASKSVDRIIDTFSAGDKSMVRAMLSESVQSIISQSLLPKIEGGPDRRLGDFNRHPRGTQPDP